MNGTESQIEWAAQIKQRVNAEFDRVDRALRAKGTCQDGESRSDIQTILTILKEKRAEVMANHQAGYFIRDWGELSNQVREMITRDPRYAELRANRAAQQRETADLPLESK